MQGTEARTKVTKQQIKKIKTLQGKLGLSDEDYRVKLGDFWVKSCTDLSYDDAETLIAEMVQEATLRGVWTKPAGPPTGQAGKQRYEHLGIRRGMANPKQLRMIEAMWADVSYVHDAAGRQSALRKFLLRIVGVEAMEFVESKHVSKLVTAFKSMKNRR